MRPRVIFQYKDLTSDKIILSKKKLLPIVAKALLRNLQLEYVLVMLGGEEGGHYKLDAEKTLAETDERVLVSIDGNIHGFEE